MSFAKSIRDALVRKAPMSLRSSGGSLLQTTADGKREGPEPGLINIYGDRTVLN